jgi:hypothetical protein
MSDLDRFYTFDPQRKVWILEENDGEEVRYEGKLPTSEVNKVKPNKTVKKVQSEEE